MAQQPDPEKLPKDLRRGAKGQRVEALQRFLGERGFPVTVDGDFGEQTERMVRAVQMHLGVWAHGQFDDETIAAFRGVGMRDE